MTNRALCSMQPFHASLPSAWKDMRDGVAPIDSRKAMTDALLPKKGRLAVRMEPGVGEPIIPAAS